MSKSTEQRARALEWLVESERDLSQSRIQEWERWIADPEHQAAFDEMAELWQRTGHIGPLPVPDAVELASDDYDGSGSIADWSARQAVNEYVPPDEETDRISALPQPAARRLRRPSLAAAAAAAVAALAWIAYPVLRSAFTAEPQFYETTLAQHRQITLEDGSHVLLGAQTSLWVTYTHQRRIVVLDRGEARFDVAHDENRPFSVRAGHGAITAVGTSFSVQRERERVKVTVAEGIVRVEPRVAESRQERAANAIGERPVVATVTKGQQVRYDERVRGKVSIKRVGADFATAWGEGRLQYIDEPLYDVVADVNRYARRQIVIDDPQAHDLRFTGILFQDNAEEWGEQLTDIFPILEVVEANAEYLVLRAKPRDRGVGRNTGG
jgi:transmembrane sensor